MATKVIIPTSYGSPSATFWINDQKYVLPTGVEVTAPDEVALLIAQHEAQEKRDEPQRYLPDVVDVVFKFDSFSATNNFPGTSNKSYEQIVKELGGREVRYLNVRIVNAGGVLSMPYKVEMVPNNFTVYLLGSAGTYGLRIYTAILTSTSGLNVTGEPKANLTGTSI